MLYTIGAVLLVLWLLGLVFNVVGGLIDVLLVIAVVVIVYQLITAKRRAH